MNKHHVHPTPGRRIGLARKAIPVVVLLGLGAKAFAQNPSGTAGLQQANTLVGSYFDLATTLMLSIGAVVGVIGAVKVYNAWSHGDQQTNKLAASWFGACIFLVVVAAVLKSFFGVS
jgi:Domain of unknown function (DUF4134)